MNKLTGNVFEELKNSISGEVYTDKLRRYMLSTDGSIFRVEPACVVYPKNTEDVVAVCKFAANYKLSIHSRGAGSGLCGSSIGRGIVLDFSKFMNNLISIDDDMTFTVEPGYRYGELEAELKGTGLFFPPYPSSGEYATFGGMYSTNAGGAYSVMYGNVADYIVDAEIVMHDGTVTTLEDIANSDVLRLHENLRDLYSLIRQNVSKIDSSYPPVRCNVSGFELRHVVNDNRLSIHKLLGGSEGTLAIVTQLKFRLIKKPKFDSLIVAYFNDKTSSAKAAQIALKYSPAGIEIMDKSLLKLAASERPDLADKIPQDVDNVLLIEFMGDTLEKVTQDADDLLKNISGEFLTQNIFMAVSEEEKASFFAVRKAAVPILYQLKGKKKILALVEDAAVPTDKLVEYFDGLYKIFERNSVQFVSYGHIAKGLLHNRPLLDLKDPYDIKLLKVLADEVFELVQSLNGTISGEHGDGRLRSCYIPRQYADIYDIFLKVKKILDPSGMFNPEIKTYDDPYQMTKHLRFGGDYSGVDEEKKQLIWSEGFELEAEKCHGCSKCTTVTNATRMCPVYKATRDESAAPKAKANVLRALLSNAIPKDSVYNEAFNNVINKCVNCGSCSVECPSKVNIPKLALEVKARYANKLGTPIDAKLVTNFELAGRTIRKISGFVSFIMKPEFMRKISQRLTNLAYQRPFVHFSSRSLSERIERTSGTGDKVVMYFAGCYASYIRPEIGESAVSVLTKLGYKVVTPNQHCCGIPHLSKGMAKGAKKQIKKNIAAWGNLIDNVDYIVATCSSCALSLIKEWGYYSDDDIVKKVAAKTIHISELVLKNKGDLQFDGHGVKLAYHNACHMRLMKDPQSSFKLISSMPDIEVEDLNSNCCGMAGSWGIAAKNYDLSVKIGTPMVEKLVNSEAQIGVTDCPTCAMQMEHLGNKPILHTIEVIDRCIK